MTRKRRVVQAIDFRSLPPLDTVLFWEGQRYVVVGSELYRRNDGLDVPLIRWRSHCPECDAPFETTTTLKARNPNRRCPKHHRIGVAVSNGARKRQHRFLARRGRRKANANRVR